MFLSLNKHVIKKINSLKAKTVITDRTVCDCRQMGQDKIKRNNRSK